MGALFGVTFNQTNTTSATVPMWNLTGGTTKRVRLYHLIIGSDATPANQASKFQIQRASARGTSSSSVTPLPLDPADAACAAFYDTGWGSNPTLTSAAIPLQIPLNQQATVQWMVDPKMGIVIPATSGAGLAMISNVTTSAANYVFSTFFEE